MSKKRFVEFYLLAMLKAATGSKAKLAYIYYDLTREEIVRLGYECGSGGAVYEIPVTKLDLLEIAVAVIEKVQGIQK